MIVADGALWPAKKLTRLERRERAATEKRKAEELVSQARVDEASRAERAEKISQAHTHFKNAGAIKVP